MSISPDERMAIAGKPVYPVCVWSTREQFQSRSAHPAPRVRRAMNIDVAGVDPVPVANATTGVPSGRTAMLGAVSVLKKPPFWATISHDQRCEVQPVPPVPT